MRGCGARPTAQRAQGRAWPGLVAPYLEARLTVLGADGFGRSDTRAALRGFFEVNRHHVVVAALDALVQRGTLDRKVCAAAIAKYGSVQGSKPPWQV